MPQENKNTNTPKVIEPEWIDNETLLEQATEEREVQTGLYKSASKMATHEGILVGGEKVTELTFSPTMDPENVVDTMSAMAQDAENFGEALARHVEGVITNMYAETFTRMQLALWAYHVSKLKADEPIRKKVKSALGIKGRWAPAKILMAYGFERDNAQKHMVAANSLVVDYDGDVRDALNNNETISSLAIRYTKDGERYEEVAQIMAENPTLNRKEATDEWQARRDTAKRLAAAADRVEAERLEAERLAKIEADRLEAELNSPPTIDPTTEGETEGETEGGTEGDVEPESDTDQTGPAEPKQDTPPDESGKELVRDLLEEVNPGDVQGPATEPDPTLTVKSVMLFDYHANIIEARDALLMLCNMREHLQGQSVPRDGLPVIDALVTSMQRQISASKYGDT